MKPNLLHSTPHLNFFQNDGWTYASRKTRTYMEGNHKPDGVCIVAMHIQKMGYVVLKQFRKSIGTHCYEAVGGLCDGNESIEECARRELKEETGLGLVKVLATIPCTFPSVGLTDEIDALMLCAVAGEPSTAGNEASEDIEILFWNAEQLKNAINLGLPVDGRLGMLSLFEQGLENV